MYLRIMFWMVTRAKQVVYLAAMWNWPQIIESWFDVRQLGCFFSVSEELLNFYCNNWYPILGIKIKLCGRVWMERSSFPLGSAHRSHEQKHVQEHFQCCFARFCRACQAYAHPFINGDREKQSSLREGMSLEIDRSFRCHYFQYFLEHMYYSREMTLSSFT